MGIGSSTDDMIGTIIASLPIRNFFLAAPPSLHSRAMRSNRLSKVSSPPLSTSSCLPQPSRWERGERVSELTTDASFSTTRRGSQEKKLNPVVPSVFPSVSHT
eukprot:756776-Hanusia_phi.AAC.3